MKVNVEYRTGKSSGRIRSAFTTLAPLAGAIYFYFRPMQIGALFM